jgi:chemotaxis protein methyltransferase CheR
VQSAGCRSFSEFLAHAQADKGGAIRRQVIDAITTGETLFFRDSAPFDLLRAKILPELVDRRTRAGSKMPIRVWSAACSTGQEVYSIAMAMKETLPDQHRLEARVLGTDISNAAIGRASQGIYSEIEVSRGLTEGILGRHFTRMGDKWKVRDEIRAMAGFKTVNLMEDFSALGRFDVIFCRNVAIYFNDRDRASLFARLEKSLERQGFLIVGAMESLSAVCPQLESKRHLRTIYYQPRSV